MRGASPVECSGWWVWAYCLLRAGQRSPIGSATSAWRCARSACCGDFRRCLRRGGIRRNVQVGLGVLVARGRRHLLRLGVAAGSDRVLAGFSLRAPVDRSPRIGGSHVSDGAGEPASADPAQVHRRAQSATDPAGDKTTYGYDVVGHRVFTVSPAGNVSGANPVDHRSVSVVNPAGEVLASLDPNAHGVADGFTRYSTSSSGDGGVG